MLNYVDRQMIALLKPTLEVEFGWSDRDYGHMASAFQFAAALAFLGVGWAIDRLGLKCGFALGVGGWSLAAMAHTVATTVGSFITVRAVLGVFEATGTPAAVKSAALYFSPRDRSKILGLGNMAPNVGAVVAPLVIPGLALAFGWRQTFLVAGGLGLVWVAVWFAARMPPELAQPTATTEARAPIVALLADRRQWALIAAKALTDPVWWFLLFFLPDLFHRVFHLSQAALGRPVALVYALAAVGALSGGWLPGRLLARGLSLDTSRKGAMLVYACLIVPVPVVLWATSPWPAALGLGVALFAHQGFSTNVFAFAADVFPARVVSGVIGVAAFAGNMAGIVMIEFAGWSLGAGYGYAPMIAFASVAYLLALTAIQLLVPNRPRLASRGDD